MADGDCISSVVGGPSGSAFALPAGVALGSGFVSIGALPAQSGALRLTNAEKITARNAANTADVPLIALGNDDRIDVGDPAAALNSGVSLNGTGYAQVFSYGPFYCYSGGAQTFVEYGTQFSAANPMRGLNVPTGSVDGMLTKAMANADKTLTATEYNAQCVKLTGALTATRNVVFPTPIDDAHSYVKTIWCQTTGFGVYIKHGVGLSVLLAVSDAPRACLFTPDGVRLVL